MENGEEEEKINITKFAGLVTHQPGRLPPINRFPPALRSSEGANEVQRVVHQFLNNDHDFRCPEYELDIPMKTLKAIVKNKNYRAPQLTPYRYAGVNYKFPENMNHPSVQHLATHLDGLINLYCEAMASADESLIALKKAVIFNSKLHMLTHGGWFTMHDDACTPIQLDVTRTVRNLYNAHRSHMITLSCIRHEAIQTEYFMTKKQFQGPMSRVEEVRNRLASENMEDSEDDHEAIQAIMSREPIMFNIHEMVSKPKTSMGSPPISMPSERPIGFLPAHTTPAFDQALKKCDSNESTSNDSAISCKSEPMDQASGSEESAGLDPSECPPGIDPKDYPQIFKTE